MDFNKISEITKLLQNLEPKTYSLNIEMTDGQKIVLAKDETAKNKTIGFRSEGEK